jgi:phospholipase C
MPSRMPANREIHMASDLASIDTIVIVMMENRSFDHVAGLE